MKTPTKARAIRVKVLVCSRCHGVTPLAAQRERNADRFAERLVYLGSGYYRWKPRGMKLKSISLHADARMVKGVKRLFHPAH